MNKNLAFQPNSIKSNHPTLALSARAGWALWTGVILVSAVTALACGITVSMLETGIHAGDDYLQGFSGGTAAILTFTAPSGIAVVASIMRLAVDLGRPAYARWQLEGISPLQTSLVVSTQVAVASVIGAVVVFAAAVLYLSMGILKFYRATGADLPFGNPTRAHHGVAMEGYFWRSCV